MDDLKIKLNIENELNNIKKKIESLKLKPLKIKLELDTYSIQNELSKLQLKCNDLIEKTKIAAQNLNNINSSQSSNKSNRNDYLLNYISDYVNNHFQLASEAKNNMESYSSGDEIIKSKSIRSNEITNIDSSTKNNYDYIESEKELIKMQEAKINAFNASAKSNYDYAESEKGLSSAREATLNAFNASAKSSYDYTESLKSQTESEEKFSSVATQKNYEYIESEKQVVKAQNVSKASTIALSLAKAALTSVIDMGISLAINFAVKALDNYINRHEKLLEKAQEAQKKSESLKNEVNSLGNEIEKVSQKIKELNSIENLSIYEQEELENLKSLNEELERNLLIKKQQAEIAEKEARKQAKEVFNDKVSESKTYYIENGTVSSMPTSDKITRTQRIQQNSDEYKELVKEREKYLYDNSSDAQSTVDNINQTLDNLKSSILDDLSDLSELSMSLDKNSDEYKDFISSYNSFQNTIKSTTINTIDNFFSGNIFEEEEKALKNLAIKGKLTVTQITSLYPYLSEELEPFGLTLDDISERFNQMYSSSNNFTENQESNTETLVNTLSKYSNKLSSIKSAQDEIANSNALSHDTIQKLLSDYPELENALAGYVSGLKSASDINSILSTQYQIDENNFKKALAVKNQYNESFYKNLISSNAQKVNEFNEQYGIDLKNYKTLAEAKLKIEEKFFNKNRWSQWYDTKTGKYTKEAEAAAGSGDPEFYRFYKSSKDLKNALSSLDTITYEGVDINLDSFGAKNNNDSYSNDSYLEKFQEEYDSLQSKRSNDLINAQQYYEKLKQLNKDYFYGKEKYKEQYQIYELELHRLEQDFAQKRINDIEFNLELKINAKGEENTLNEQIKAYTDIQKELHILAEKERSLAVGRNEELIQKYSQQWWDYEKKKLDITKQYYNKQKSIYEDQISTIEKIQDMTVSMIKKEMEMNKQLHQDKIKSINEEFDLKRSILDQELDEYSYNKELKSKTDNINKIQAQIDLIKNDDSNKAKLKQLEDELANAIAELDDFQYNHNIDIQKQILDEQEKLLTEKHQTEINAIDEKLNNEVYLRQLADERIKQSGQNLYNELITFSQKYGTISKHEIDEIWSKYSLLMDNFDIRQNGTAETLNTLYDQLSSIKNILEEINDISLGDFSSSKYSKPRTKEDVISDMRANSKAWHETTDTKLREDLQIANIKLAEELERILKDLGIISEDDSLMRSSNGELRSAKTGIRYYHTGGFVSGNNLSNSLKPNELHSILEEGELVISKNGVKNLLENIIPVKNISALNIPNSDYASVSGILSLNHNHSRGDIIIENSYNITGTTSEELLNNVEKMVNKNSDYTIKRIAELAKNNYGNKINTVYNY